MMNHIDVSTVLRETLACDLYSNLVTRSTGAAVRGQIERLLSTSRDRALTIIDFTQVSMIDISCADEVVAKLLMRYASDNPPQEVYFLFRGVTEHHWDAIEAVLERHGLALAVEQNDGVVLMGVVSDDERSAWTAAFRDGGVDAAVVASETGGDTGAVQRALDALCRRRLIMQVGSHYIAVGSNRG